MQEYTTQSKPSYSAHAIHPKLNENYSMPNTPLHIHVEQALTHYLLESKGQPITGLYSTLLAAVEPTLLKVALEFSKTQHDAAKILGMSRGTLRKKLKQYHLIVE